MALQVYEQYAIKINGVLLSDNISLNITGVGQDQDVETTPKGFAGQSSSPRKLQIEPTDALSGAGEAIDVWGLWNAGATVEVEVIRLLANTRLKTTGFLRDPKSQAGVGRTTEVSWMLMCEPAEWE